MALDPRCGAYSRAALTVWHFRAIARNLRAIARSQYYVQLHVISTPYVQLRVIVYVQLHEKTLELAEFAVQKCYSFIVSN